MGGLETDKDSAVLGADSKPVPAFYAAGEVAGGVHGNNRFGGNSRLDCVMFGRVVGLACARYMLGDLSRRLLVEARVRDQKSGQASLGENSPLDCVIYARVAGAACAKYVLGDCVKVTSLAALAGGGKDEGSKK